MPAQKAKNFKGDRDRLLGYLRPHRAGARRRHGRRRHRHGVQRARTEAPRHGDDEDLRRLSRQGARRAGRARRFRLRRPHPAGLIVLYIIGNAFQYLMQYLMANIAQKTVYEMRRRSGGEIRSAAAEVLRYANAGRGDEPRRQRSGQHQRHAAAEPHAAADVGADADWRHRHDADDQLDPDARHRPDAAAQHRHRRARSRSGRRSSS